MMGNLEEGWDKESLAPHGASGLKLFFFALMMGWGRSRPTRGEWIEIGDMGYVNRGYGRLAPHGASGLKSCSPCKPRSP